MVKLNGEYADIVGKSIAEIVEEGGYNPARVAVELRRKSSTTSCLNVLECRWAARSKTPMKLSAADA